MEPRGRVFTRYTDTIPDHLFGHQTYCRCGYRWAKIKCVIPYFWNPHNKCSSKNFNSMKLLCCMHKQVVTSFKSVLLSVHLPVSPSVCLCVCSSPSVRSSFSICPSHFNVIIACLKAGDARLAWKALVVYNYSFIHSDNNKHFFLKKQKKTRKKNPAKGHNLLTRWGIVAVSPFHLEKQRQSNISLHVIVSEYDNQLGNIRSYMYILSATKAALLHLYLS